MPSFSFVQASRLSRSAGSVIQSRYWTLWSPLRTKRIGPRAILPTSDGGAGGRFFSVRRSGVAGRGRGGNDSPPVRLWGFARGGGPQSTGPDPSWALAEGGSASIPEPAAPAAVQ